VYLQLTLVLLTYLFTAMLFALGKATGAHNILLSCKFYKGTAIDYMKTGIASVSKDITFINHSFTPNKKKGLIKISGDTNALNECLCDAKAHDNLSFPGRTNKCNV
jgi:hypothetical protein